MSRLSSYPGPGRGPSRVIHAFVSMIGILGMFAAVTGALFGPWIAEGEEDEDGFQFWDTCEGEYGKETGCEREEQYRLLRLVEVP